MGTQDTHTHCNHKTLTSPIDNLELTRQAFHLDLTDYCQHLRLNKDLFNYSDEKDACGATCVTLLNAATVKVGRHITSQK